MLKRLATFLFLLAALPAKAAVLAGGVGHNVALSVDGTVWCWGLNDKGQLGNNTADDSTMAIKTWGLSNIVAVAAGDYHSLALAADGTIWAWGDNAYGELGDDTTLDRDAPVKVAFIDNAVAIAAGARHSLAVGADGTVWGWGDNSFGQLGTGTTTRAQLPVAAYQIANLTAVIAAGNTSYAVDRQGAVYAWGDNSYGQLGNGTTSNSTVPLAVSGLNNVTQLAAAPGHAIAVTAAGNFLSWGDNSYGQLGDDTTNAASHIKTTPGAVVLSPVPVSIFAAPGDSYFTDSSGQAWGFGHNTNDNQLLDGTHVDRHIPVYMSQLPAGFPVGNIDSVASGANHRLLVASNGSVWAWGSNQYGQLGNGSTTDSTTPVPVTGSQLLVGIKGRFSASWSGVYRDLTLSVRITVPLADTGRLGSTYIAMNRPWINWYFLSAKYGWVPFDGINITPYQFGPLATTEVLLYDHADVTSLNGAEYWLGYGATSQQMLDRNNYAMVFEITL